MIVSRIFHIPLVSVCSIAVHSCKMHVHLIGMRSRGCQPTIEEQTHRDELHDEHRHTKAVGDLTFYSMGQKEKENAKAASCTGFVTQEYGSVSYWVPSGMTGLNNKFAH